MAIKTVTGGVGGADFTPGWKELIIKNAKYGTYNNNKYIDIWFEDYPENLNCRAYEAINKLKKNFVLLIGSSLLMLVFKKS